MDWQTLGAIGELAGALLVAVSLVYLAGQVRLANRISRAEAFRNVTARLVTMNTTGMTDPLFRSAFRKVWVEGARRSDLDDDERIVMGLYMSNAFDLLEQTWREVREGLLPSDAVESPARIYLLPYTRDVWPFIRDNYPPDTVRFVEGFLGFDRPIGPEASLSTPQETPPST